MDPIHQFFVGSTPKRYVEAGFSDKEAEAMTWIAEQKSKGKFLGFLSGSFVALTWGHFHERIFAHLNIRCSRVYSQLAILGVRMF